MARTLILLYLHKSLPDQLSNGEVFLPVSLSLDEANYMTNSLVGDSYLVLARRWVELGYVAEAKIVAIRYPHGHSRYSPQGLYELGEKVRAYILPNAGEYLKIHQPQAGDILFIRGQSDWEPILGHHQQSFKIFYNGSSTDRWQPRWPVDVIFVDSLANRLNGTRCVEFLKSPDEDIFKPLGIEKPYDLCFIARFTARDKKGQLEFARLADKSWKAIFVGELEDGAAAQELGRLWPSCEITGHVSKKEVNEILNRSKVSVVYSCENDASPRIIVESLAAGTPVIVHKRNVGRKYVTRRCGELVSHLTTRWKLNRILQFPDRYDPAAEFSRLYSSRVVACKLWESLELNESLSPESAGAV